MLQVSAGAIFRSNGCVLLCQRGYGDCAGLWEFPGGKREPGEDACACLEREIREELNLRIRCTEVLDSVVYAYPNRTIELTLVRAEILQGEPELTEHTALRWLHGEEIQPEELCPADRELLLKCQGKLFSYKN